jgi:hypothetical protein
VQADISTNFAVAPQLMTKGSDCYDLSQFSGVATAVERHGVYFERNAIIADLLQLDGSIEMRFVIPIKPQ